jgi:hypothetical protein
MRRSSSGVGDVTSYRWATSSLRDYVGPKSMVWYTFCVVTTVLTLVVLLSIPVEIGGALGYVIYSMAKNWRRR